MALTSSCAVSDASVSRSSGKDEHRAADQAGLLAVWIVFALTRFYLLLMFLPQFSDLQVYFGYESIFTKRLTGILRSSIRRWLTG